MTRKFTSTKLGAKILVWILVSLVSAIITFVISSNLFNVIIKTNYESKVYLDEQTIRICQEFQDYVTQNDISSHDIQAIGDFAKNLKQTSFNLVDGNTLIYSSTDGFANLIIEEFGTQQFYEDSSFVEIHFTDKSAQMRVNGFFGGNLHVLALIASFLLSFVLFLIILLNMIKTHVDYIVRLESEVSILESGNLKFPVTIKGNDELARLAHNIEQMRVSFIEKLENEDKAKTANSELITAMSHDLRTPLTTQIGYLDIIELRKYKDEEQLFEYVHKTREKAYQIKNLSDKLFKYFLAFEDESSQRAEVQKEEYSANELLGQIFEENIFFIKEKGFIVEYKMLAEKVYINTNAEYIFRIFDNIFSNINKYASKEIPIKIELSSNPKNILISCVNGVSPVAPNVQSTEIGLKNSQKIANELGGTLIYNKTDNTFFLQFTLPIS